MDNMKDDVISADIIVDRIPRPEYVPRGVEHFKYPTPETLIAEMSKKVVAESLILRRLREEHACPPARIIALDPTQILFVPEGQTHTLRNGCALHGPCYVSPDGESTFFPDGDIYMRTSVFDDILKCKPSVINPLTA